MLDSSESGRVAGAGFTQPYSCGNEKGAAASACARRSAIASLQSLGGHARSGAGWHGCGVQGRGAHVGGVAALSTLSPRRFSTDDEEEAVAPEKSSRQLVGFEFLASRNPRVNPTSSAREG